MEDMEEKEAIGGFKRDDGLQAIHNLWLAVSVYFAVQELLYL